MAEIILPPQYEDFVVLPAGGTFVDPAFGTTIRRITAVPPGRFKIPEYSSAQAFNKDGSRFLLVDVDHFAFHDESGALLQDLAIGASARPRWSRTDPDFFYFMEGNTLKKFSVGAGAASTVRKFGEFASIDNKGEADISNAGQLVLCGDDRFVFVYDPLTDKRGPRLDTAGNRFESLYLNDDSVLISWGAKGTARFQGMELYSRDMEPIRNVANANGHKCLGVDVDGSPILIWNTSDEDIPVGAVNTCPNGMQKINLHTFERTCLLTLPWIEITHVSPGPGFCVVSTYSKPGGDWQPYRDELLLIPYDGSPVRRLAHHRARTTMYEDQAWPTVSRDGRRVLFGSDMAAPSTEQVDTYMLLLDPPSAIPTPPGGSRTDAEIRARLAELRKRAEDNRAAIAELEWVLGITQSRI